MATTAPGLQRPKARPSLQTPHFPEKGILASEQETWGEGSQAGLLCHNFFWGWGLSDPHFL